MKRTSKRKRFVWSPDDVLVLKTCYADSAASVVALMIGCSVNQVYRKAHKLGLTKSEKFYESQLSGRLKGVSGIEGRFKKGAAPWNKGLKGVTTGGQITQFAKGSKPHNWLPIGSERLLDGYLQRKMTDTGYPPRDWRPVHVLNWEALNGPVPPGHALAFRDGNKTNIDPVNLELISRKELMARNTIHNLPPQIKEVIHIRAGLVRMINRKEKEHEPNNR